MARIAKKKKVDNNAGLLNTIEGIDKSKVKDVVDFGRFIVVILKDAAIFHTHTGFEVRTKAWAVNINGEVVETNLYMWLCNLVEMHKAAKGHEKDEYPGTGVTYTDILDAEIIMTEANLTHPIVAFVDMEEAAKFSQERLQYLTEKTKELDDIMNSEVSPETEEELKEDFKHGQQAIANEIVIDAIKKEKEV